MEFRTNHRKKVSVLGVIEVCELVDSARFCNSPSAKLIHSLSDWVYKG
jgi:hypothetical protein